jgi:hypothetical protein
VGSFAGSLRRRVRDDDTDTDAEWQLGRAVPAVAR